MLLDDREAKNSQPLSAAISSPCWPWRPPRSRSSSPGSSRDRTSSGSRRAPLLRGPSHPTARRADASASDALILTWPNLEHWTRSFAADPRGILWNPLVACGTPFLANQVAFPLYPSNLLAWAGGFRAFLLWAALLHVVLANVGAYLALRRLRPRAARVRDRSMVLRRRELVSRAPRHRELRPGGGVAPVDRARGRPRPDGTARARPHPARGGDRALAARRHDPGHAPHPPARGGPRPRAGRAAGAPAREGGGVARRGIGRCRNRARVPAGRAAAPSARGVGVRFLARAPGGPRSRPVRLPAARVGPSPRSRSAGQSFGAVAVDAALRRIRSEERGAPPDRRAVVPAGGVRASPRARRDLHREHLFPARRRARARPRGAHASVAPHPVLPRDRPSSRGSSRWTRRSCTPSRPCPPARSRIRGASSSSPPPRSRRSRPSARNACSKSARRAWSRSFPRSWSSPGSRSTPRCRASSRARSRRGKRSRAGRPRAAAPGHAGDPRLRRARARRRGRVLDPAAEGGGSRRSRPSRSPTPSCSSSARTRCARACRHRSRRRRPASSPRRVRDPLPPSQGIPVTYEDPAPPCRIARFQNAVRHLPTPIPSNAGMLFGFRDQQGYGGILPRRLEEVVEAIEPGVVFEHVLISEWRDAGVFRLPVLRFLGVRHIAERAPRNPESDHAATDPARVRSRCSRTSVRGRASASFHAPASSRTRPPCSASSRGPASIR